MAEHPDGTRKPSGVLCYHGTTSGRAETIQKDGFLPWSYFTTSAEDAKLYAAMGGEEDLQRREEEYERTTSHNAREEYYPDIWDMYRALYPKGEYPVVICVSLPPNVIEMGEEDSGGARSLLFVNPLPSSLIVDIRKVDWETSALGDAMSPGYSTK